VEIKKKFAWNKKLCDKCNLFVRWRFVFTVTKEYEVFSNMDYTVCSACCSGNRCVASDLIRKNIERDEARMKSYLRNREKNYGVYTRWKENVFDRKMYTLKKMK
jgi:hypothetical protein